MKKIKLLAAFMALVLSASMLLTACGKKEEEEEKATYKLADIMNADYVAEEDGVLSSSTKLSTVGDYVDAEGNFILTSEEVEATETEAAYYIDRVYNASTGKEIAKLNEKKSEATGNVTKYYVDVISDNYFAVLALTEIKETATNNNNNNNGGSIVINPSADYTSNYAFSGVTISFGDKYSNALTIRDAEGTVVKTYDNDALWTACSAAGSFDVAYNGTSSSSSAGVTSMIYEYQDAEDYDTNGKELFFVGQKLYRADKDGNMTLVKDFGLTKQPYSLTSMSKVGDFYLGREDSSDTYVVYDKDFNKLYEYVLPGYVGYASECALLANGELLIQYYVGLDQNAEEYDFSVPNELNQKFDLVTMLVNAEGATELTDVNYIIGSVKASVADEDGQKVYSDIVENLAFIYPINEDKYYNDGVDNRKLVLLSNKVEVTAEVELEEKIYEAFPSQYLGEYYSLRLADGTSYAIYDKSGAKVSELDDAIFNVSDYSSYYSTNVTVLGDAYLYNDALYDITGKQTKDLRDVDYTVLGDSLFIASNNSKGASYSLFADGKSTSIGYTSNDKKDESAFSGISCAYGYGYYYTKKTARSESEGKDVTTYTYYNEKGAKLFSTTDTYVSAVELTDDYLVLCGQEKVETKDEKTGITKTDYKSVFYRIDIK